MPNLAQKTATADRQRSWRHWTGCKLTLTATTRSLLAERNLSLAADTVWVRTTVPMNADTHQWQIIPLSHSTGTGLLIHISASCLITPRVTCVDTSRVGMHTSAGTHPVGANILRRIALTPGPRHEGAPVPGPHKVTRCLLGNSKHQTTSSIEPCGQFPNSVCNHH